MLRVTAPLRRNDSWKPTWNRSNNSLNIVQQCCILFQCLIPETPCNLKQFVVIGLQHTACYINAREMLHAICCNPMTTNCILHWSTWNVASLLDMGSLIRKFSPKTASPMRYGQQESLGHLRIKSFGNYDDNAKENVIKKRIRPLLNYFVIAPICLICFELSKSWIRRDGFQVQIEKRKLTVAFSRSPQNL